VILLGVYPPIETSKKTFGLAAFEAYPFEVENIFMKDLNIFGYILFIIIKIIK
jgi:hypothetical protein